MLIGPNPFADLLQNVEGAHRQGEAEVRGVPTEVVSLQLDDPLEQSELRLYIGKADSLLYRMEIEFDPRHTARRSDQGGQQARWAAGNKQADPDPAGRCLTSPAPPEPPACPLPPEPHKPVGAFLRFDNDLTLVADLPVRHLYLHSAERTA